MSLLTAIWLDPFGSLSETPEEQFDRLKSHYEEIVLETPLDAYAPRAISEIKPGTDLILFDYGGMMIGNSLAEDNSRALIRWAEDNPNSLVVIVSQFTYNNTFRYAIMDHLGLSEAPKSVYSIDEDHNSTPIHNIVVENGDKFIPSWFRKSDHKPAVLPTQVFFSPNKSFVSFMKKRFGKKIIFDVGAGLGRVSKILFEAGMKPIAIDSNLRDKCEYQIINLDGTEFNYIPKSVVMLCRPCHGIFTQRVVDRAIFCKCSHVVYVGLTKNVKHDLGKYYSRFKRSVVNVGEDGENLYTWNVSREIK